GAVPETLLESELFGYVRGAFTGAAASKLGLFEEADGGTLLLDEIAEMPAALQVKLLRALQSGEVRRLGATQAVTIDVRVIAATNGDLATRISQGSFREDLFYRLNVIQVTLPPLRDRREDIPALAEYFLGRAAAKLGRTLRLSPGALERLLRYPWPGNVRELENALERAAILARAENIEPEDLPPHVAAGLHLGASPALPGQITLADAERAHILQTLERFGRNHSGAAEALGIGRTTLWRKRKEYGIERGTLHPAAAAHGAASAVEPGRHQPPSVVVAEIRPVVLEGPVPDGDVDPRGQLDVVLLRRQVALDLGDDLPAFGGIECPPLTHEKVRDDRIVDVALVLLLAGVMHAVEEVVRLQERRLRSVRHRLELAEVAAGDE